MRMRALFFVCVVALAGCGSHPAQPTCTVTLSATTLTMGVAGGTGRFDVSAPAACAWVAASDANWTRITDPPGGAGTGSRGVTCSVDANPGTGVRGATITVGGGTVAVTQAGTASCEYTVAPLDFRECIRGGFDRTVSVSAAAGCGWTAAPTAPWLTLSSGSSGVGPGTITFTFGDNYEAVRQGAIEVRWPTPTTGQNVRVRQEGCLYTSTRDSFDVPAAGGDFAVDVYASPTDPACGGPLQDVCVWSGVSSAPWVTVLTTMPRHGDDRVSFRVAANSTGSLRTATISVRDRTVTIRQAG